MNKSPFPPIEVQNKIVEDIEKLKELANAHIYNTMFEAEALNTWCLDNQDSRYTPPTGDQVMYSVKCLVSKGYSKGEIARRLGVSDTKNRTLNRWEKGGSEQSQIPYAAWRLLCSMNGFSLDLMLPTKGSTNG